MSTKPKPAYKPLTKKELAKAMKQEQRDTIRYNAIMRRQGE